jgi:hypothetical protein
MAHGPVPSNAENTYQAFLSENDCAGVAGNVSCDAMKQLARDEALRNRSMCDYQTLYPACERFRELADRVEEYKLQKPPGFMRNMCFTKTPSFQEGDWAARFGGGPTPRDVRFDTWTRAKGRVPAAPTSSA